MNNNEVIDDVEYRKALDNAKTALEEAFFPHTEHDETEPELDELIEELDEEIAVEEKNAMKKMVDRLDKRVAESKKEQADDTIDETELDEVIDELETEGELEFKEEPKKSSFINNIISSFHRNKINGQIMMRRRFQALAGIPPTPAAQLTIGDKTFDLMELSPWYDIVRFKLCGFKYVIM
jgi:hypothetical protein